MSSSGCSDEDESLGFADKEWKQFREARKSEGFREGIAKGQEEFIQKGFEKGFQSISGCGFNIGKLSGILSAIKSVLHFEEESGKTFSKDLNKTIEDLTVELESFEAKLLTIFQNTELEKVEITSEKKPEVEDVDSDVVDLFDESKTSRCEMPKNAEQNLPMLKPIIVPSEHKIQYKGLCEKINQITKDLNLNFEVDISIDPP